MNRSVLFRHLGSILMLNAIIMAISAGVSACYGIDTSFWPLLCSALITGGVAVIPLCFVEREIKVSNREGYAILFFAWIFSCLFGMLPYLFYGGEFSLINAWYESVSGYTTTGGTILKSVESIPKGLLFWRSSTHWIGGMGVVLLIIILLPEQAAVRMRLAKMELSSLSQEHYRFRIRHTLRIIFSVYLGLTIAASLCYMFVGMNLFDAVNHGFSTVATGGFSTKNQSLLSYNSIGIEVVAMFFMLLSGMHFGLLFLAVTGKPMNLFRSPIIRYYVVSLLLAGLFISLDLTFGTTGLSFWPALRLGLFQSISLGTTTGFATADSSLWPVFSVIVLIFLSIQCACSGSTTGGIKVDRFCIFWASVKAQIQKFLHPQAYIPVRVGGVSLEADAVASVNLYIALYFLIIFVVAALLSLFGYDILDSFSASVAHIGNVGPGFGSVGNMSNYSHFLAAPKMMCTIEMLLGRLEIFGFIMIFKGVI